MGNDKKKKYVATNVMNIYAKFQLHPPYGFWGEDFLIIFWKFTLYDWLPWRPIKFSDLDKIHMYRRPLLKKHFCRKKSKYLQWDNKNCHFHFSHYKSMETISCHSNQSSYPIGTKRNTIIVPPKYRCFTWNMERIGFRGEVVWKCWPTDGRTTDACLNYKLTYEPSAQVS